jgi:hypothetical protein
MFPNGQTLAVANEHPSELRNLVEIDGGVGQLLHHDTRPVNFEQTRPGLPSKALEVNAEAARRDHALHVL